MADRQNKADITAKYISDLVRKRVLAAIARHDAAISKSYEAIAVGIRKDLRAVGFTVEQVREILEKHFGATAADRTKAIEESITTAAREARTMPRDVFEAVYGAEVGEAAAAPLAPRSRQTQTPSLRLVPASEDESPSTG